LIWLKTHEVAQLLNLHESTIKKAIKNDKYEYRHIKGKGRGGIQIEIALESLPQEAQDRYYGKEQEVQKSVYMSLTAEQRKAVDQKLNIVLKYKEFKEAYPQADKMQAYLSQYNEQKPDNPLTYGTLQAPDSQLKNQSS
jgi:hypothetical protein